MTARVSDERLAELIQVFEGVMPVVSGDGEDNLQALRELLARRQQMSGIAQRSAEKAASQLRGSGYLPDATNHEQSAAALISAIIEQESERNGKQ